MTRDEIRTLLAYAAGTTRDWAPTTVDVDLWLQLLDDIEYHDALDALAAHARATHHRPVPADIRAGVKRIRADRIERRPYDWVPDADPDVPIAYQRALRAGNARHADGTEQPRDLTALPATFRDVPAASPTAIEAARDQVSRIRPKPRQRDLTHTEATADMDRMLADQAHAETAEQPASRGGGDPR